MRKRAFHRTLFTLLVSFLCAVELAHGQSRAPVTTPESFFGHEIGADYVLPDYERLVEFWHRVDGESDRLEITGIGKTAEGRTQYMAIVTSPANHARLERYKEISQRLARAEGLSPEEARALASEGKAVVWIDGGLHATEVLGAQQLVETVYQLVSRNDPETLRILDDVIVLAVHANPDGHQLVADWYMREQDPQKRRTDNIPRLYQKYIGHDNNRDFFMSTQAESENLNRQLYHEWFPQIMYNHHQSGPVGTVMFAPPFRDPFNYVFDPLIITGLDLVGAAMHNRFIAEGKPGVTMRRGANYSTWWNGGLRTTVYFHNMIGLLTETIGNPTPIDIPFVPARQIPSGDLPAPIAPQKWHFRSSVDYSVTANYAVLDIARRYRDRFLYNIYQMGRNSIERGSRDSWTTSPARLDAARQELRVASDTGQASTVMTTGSRQAAASPEQSQRYYSLMRRPELRDPRGYILSAEQPDFPRVIHLINALRENGITVHVATQPFEVNGRRYPVGSYVIRTAQAFRPFILDTFEPQDHPNDFLYPGGPPIPPYDVAGWTLAYQMGVQFDRILDDFSGPFREVEEWNVRAAPGRVATGRAAGYLLSAAFNDAFPAALRLLSAGEEVYRLNASATSATGEIPAGSYYIRAKGGTRQRLQKIATELGVDFQVAPAPPAGEHLRLRRPRIALWDRYGGSMPSGWTRWVLEQKGIPFEVVYPADLDAGRLRKRYDAIILVDGAVPDSAGGGSAGPTPESVPEEFRGHLGKITISKTVPRIREFLEAGGSVITIGSSTALARHLGLPIGNHLVDAENKPLRREEYFIPGSVLQVAVDSSRTVAAGLPSRVDVLFDRSPVFTLGPGAEAQGIHRIAWYDSERPLRSGWAWGQEKLQGGAAIVEAPVGEGTLYLFGPEILFRAQPHGTFKFFLNALAASAGTPRRVR